MTKHALVRNSLTRSYVPKCCCNGPIGLNSFKLRSTSIAFYLCHKLTGFLQSVH